MHLINTPYSHYQHTLSTLSTNALNQHTLFTHSINPSDEEDDDEDDDDDDDDDDDAAKEPSTSRSSSSSRAAPTGAGTTHPSDLIYRNTPFRFIITHSIDLTYHTTPYRLSYLILSTVITHPITVITHLLLHVLQPHLVQILTGGGIEGAGGGASSGEPSGGPNACHLVWQGVLAKRTFPGMIMVMR